MKKNGFTLVELIAVITILSIVMTILIVQVDKKIKDVNDFGYEMQIESIENAAMLYAEEYRSSLTNIEEKKVDTVSLQTLLNSGLLIEKDVKDIDVSNIILIAEIDGNLKVKYIEKSQNVIFLNGPSEISVYKGRQYNEMGAYVAIPTIGLVELTSSNISSTVDTTKVGEYKVTYSYENTLSEERIVSVIN